MKLTLMGSYPDDHPVKMVHEAGDTGEVRAAPPSSAVDLPLSTSALIEVD